MGDETGRVREQSTRTDLGEISEESGLHFIELNFGHVAKVGVRHLGKRLKTCVFRGQNGVLVQKTQPSEGARREGREQPALELCELDVSPQPSNLHDRSDRFDALKRRISNVRYGKNGV